MYDEIQHTANLLNQDVRYTYLNVVGEIGPKYQSLPFHSASFDVSAKKVFPL